MTAFDPCRPKLTVLLLLLPAIALTCTGASSGVDGAAHRPRSGSVPCSEAAHLVELARHGYFPGRSPDILVIPDAPNFIGAATNPPHTGPWPFLVNVPLVLYGPGHVSREGRMVASAHMPDLAATAAHMIGFDGWSERDGRVLTEGLTETADPPRLIVTIVWDGVGWNALRSHPRAWPFLRSLMERGTTYTRFTVGSSPSVTPPVHATLGTGAYPDRHGISGVTQRTTGTNLVDPWEGYDPKRLRISTLADVYDRALHNKPLTGMIARVNWHLGMIGHGASFPGGDRDEVLLIDHSGNVQGNETDFAPPDVTDPRLLDGFSRALDAKDGALDERWRAEPLDDPAVLGNSPAFTRYQGELLRRMIDEFRFGQDDIPDLLYVNFKEADLSYHAWGMESPQVGDTIAEEDADLRRLVTHLNAQVGAENWVMMLTADHGMMPSTEDSGGFPIKGDEVLNDINARFDRTDNDADLAYHLTAYGAYIDPAELTHNDVTLNEIGRWLAGYTLRENVQGDSRLPSPYKARGSERLFTAIMVGRKRVDPCSPHP